MIFHLSYLIILIVQKNSLHCVEFSGTTVSFMDLS